jgi:ATP-dependent RNA helicase DDX24/MAK5
VHDKASNTPIVVTDESLQWREVAIPERLEDAEGFFGLEEIDGAEIVKAENNSRVQFQVSYSSCEDTTQF